MTDPHDHDERPPYIRPDLGRDLDRDRYRDRDLDRVARGAARGLHAHVLERVDVERSLHDLGSARPRARHRVLAVAAALLLVTGTVAVIGQGGDENRSRVDLDEGLPDVPPGELRALGPRDGRDSIQLPITVEPATDLADGDTVAVSGDGFQPGERVGIVQCAREAGGDTAEVRGGVDGCYLGDVQYAEADDSGTVHGTYTVQRVLTTAITGTVDCAAEAERCIVAVGALSDYDRSGGQGIAFAAAGGEPIEVPDLAVSPTADLADGDVVHVSGRGFTPGDHLSLTVCATDPSACWQTGEQMELDGSEAMGEGYYPGLVVDDDGAVDGEVPVWRFLPGPEPGTYVDCAVSTCSLRVLGTTAPPPAQLTFTSDGGAPEPPAFAVEPADDLAPGDVVLVRGVGFVPGTFIQVTVCAGPPGEAAYGARSVCGSSQYDDLRVDDDGTFTVEYEIPELGSGYATETTMCAADGCDTGSAPTPVDVTCDGTTTECLVLVDSFADGPSPSVAPIWTASPVPITFR